MKLHWSPKSPYVRKVMICAHELGVADRLELVRSVAAMLKPNARLMQDNPLSKIPTLVLDDGFTLFESRPETFERPLDITQIALVCALGYADFRFADCGWRKAYPKLDKFHQKMLERPSIKISVPPPA